MTYWKIDRLSTFIGMNEEKYPKLTQLFCDAGMGELFQLKDKEFDIDNLQEANMDGLRDCLNLEKEMVSLEMSVV
ncbi:MAG: hypothetical protein JEZ03_13965 [Bacteroidales bacterium]|nr:hypothetical protein [Bacteroidales bacterium]